MRQRRTNGSTVLPSQQVAALPLAALRVYSGEDPINKNQLHEGSSSSLEDNNKQSKHEPKARWFWYRPYLYSTRLRKVSSTILNAIHSTKCWLGCCGSVRLSNILVAVSLLLWFMALYTYRENAVYRYKYEMYQHRRKVCGRPVWHQRHKPNCMSVHDIDLQHVLIQAAGTTDRNHTATSQWPVTRSRGVLGSGYWRTVFGFASQDGVDNNDKDDVTGSVVLKMMKPEHDVDAYQFDRHRRDAVVMELLAGNPNVVDIYGFCGNSVVTEYIATPLDRLLLSSSSSSLVSSKNDSNNHKAGPETNMVLSSLRQTRVGRLRLAYEVAKALQALHATMEYPIIHVDIDLGQFLVTPTGRVKINDFNRCRFMGYWKDSKKKCNMKVSEAPGLVRAPEEYALDEQDEKIDIYSTGHVFYAILMGKYAWSIPRWDDFIEDLMDDYPILESSFQGLIQLGLKPTVPWKIRQSDPELHHLMQWCYELDPRNRPSATQLVHALEMILSNHTDMEDR